MVDCPIVPPVPPPVSSTLLPKHVKPPPFPKALFLLLCQPPWGGVGGILSKSIVLYNMLGSLLRFLLKSLLKRLLKVLLKCLLKSFN